MLQRVVRIVSQVVDPNRDCRRCCSGSGTAENMPSTIITALDEHPGRGPLEGLAAGFRSLPKDVVAVYATSCDVPLISEQFIQTMFRMLGNFDIAVPKDGNFFTHLQPSIDLPFSRTSMLC